MNKKTEDRFWIKVNKTDTCWLWMAAISKGYGCFGVDGINKPSHRISYELIKGPIPEGMHLDHLCRVRNCVNPEHLEPVTCRENLLRGETHAAKNFKKTTCHKGHPLEGDNLKKNNTGRRICRVCHIDHKRIKRLAQGMVPQGSRTHCKKGHEFTEENTYHPIGTTWKICKICQQNRYLSKKNKI